MLHFEILDSTVGTKKKLKCAKFDYRKINKKIKWNSQKSPWWKQLKNID